MVEQRQGERRMTSHPITIERIGHGRSRPPLVIIDEAQDLIPTIVQDEAPDPHWPDRLPGNVYRLLAWLQLTALPEHDAAAVVSKLSRRDLGGDDFGARTLGQVDAWLSTHGLALGE
jgi:hypothetical protein